MAQNQGQLERGGEFLLGLGMAALVALACMQVALRYFFDAAVPWMEEISIIVLVTMVWLSVIALWMGRSHIALDIVAGRLPPAWRARLELALNLLLVLLAAGLAWASRETYVAVADLELPASELPVATLYYPVMAGAIGLVAAGLHGAWRVSRGRSR